MRAEIRNMTLQLNRLEAQCRDEDKYVQVKFIGPGLALEGHRTWTYKDPGYDLRTGDLVQISTRYNERQLGLVTSRGFSDDTYPGPFSSVEKLVARRTGSRYFVKGD